MSMEAAVEELRKRREQALALGGPERIARQHARGLLNARERLDLLLDPSPRFEVTATSGFGRVGGRLVAYHATDATLKGGSGSAAMSAGRRGHFVNKTAAMSGLPFLDLAQGGGASVPEIMGSTLRSEERRVGKECRRLCRSRWSPYH
jgi:acetyl-CoA carboxylase carboxyltransferase component